MRRRWCRLLGVMLLVGVVLVWLWRRGDSEHRFDQVILAAARQYGLPPALAKAVVWQESRFHERARGKAQEIGLMQIRPPVLREWAEAEHRGSLSPRQLYDPGINTQVGAWYLAKLLRRYAWTDQPLVYALADYNAGRSNVLRWNKGAAATNSQAFLRQMDFAGTHRYLEAILQRFAYYRPLFPPPREK